MGVFLFIYLYIYKVTTGSSQFITSGGVVLHNRSHGGFGNHAKPFKICQKRSQNRFVGQGGQIKA